MQRRSQERRRSALHARAFSCPTRRRRNPRTANERRAGAWQGRGNPASPGSRRFVYGKLLATRSARLGVPVVMVTCGTAAASQPRIPAPSLAGSQVAGLRMGSPGWSGGVRLGVWLGAEMIRDGTYLLTEGGGGGGSLLAPEGLPYFRGNRHKDCSAAHR